MITCSLQNIDLVVLPTDILEIDIRDKFSVRHFSLSHFLGRAKVPVRQFLRLTDSWYVGVHTIHCDVHSSCCSSLTFRLGHRLATDRVQGSVTITITNGGHANPVPTCKTS